MSLYLEASRIISQENGSLKSRIFNEKPGTYRSSSKRLYALIVETLKHQDVLNEVIDKSGLLEVEKKVHFPIVGVGQHMLITVAYSLFGSATFARSSTE